MGTVILWGSSFPAIKVVVTNISSFTYVWLRALVAMLGIVPYVIYKVLNLRNEDTVFFSIKGGLVTGLAFALGLWLQGFGTKYTTASKSAFITGINVVFVHLYSALIKRKYSLNLGISLIMSIIGLYLLTAPKGSGVNKGDLLVLASSFFWALQVILVDTYSESDPIIFTFFEMMPSLLFILPDIIIGTAFLNINKTVIFTIIYLGLVCADAAFVLQVLGQKLVEPAIAALIFMLEPVFATIFSIIFLGEELGRIEVLGMSLILLGVFFSQKEK